MTLTPKQKRRAPFRCPKCNHRLADIVNTILAGSATVFLKCRRDGEIPLTLAPNQSAIERPTAARAIERQRP